jgi:hypothetical protein
MIALLFSAINARKKAVNMRGEGNEVLYVVSKLFAYPRLSAFICVPRKFGVLSREFGVKTDKAPF